MGLCGPYLTLMTEEAPQREYSLREVFNGLRWIIRTGAPWRMMPHDLPPWHAVYDQTQRWLTAGVFEQMVHDLRQLLRLAEGRNPEPSAAIVDSRTLQSTPESGARAGYDGAKRKKGNKVHMVVDTLGHLLALQVTAANEQDRAQVGPLAERVQTVTGETVNLVYADQNYTGEKAAQAAADHGMELHVVKLPEAKHGFVTPTLGRRAQLRVGCPFSPIGQGLRATLRDSRGVALSRLCRLDARSVHSPD